MNTSVCLTLLNEEKSVSALLNSLLNQSLKPDEIIIIDGGSTDKTVEIIRHFQKKNKTIKLLVEKCNRARGRNLSIEIAKNKIIAITDGGCIPERDWLKNIIEPFKNQNVDISAGFYKMVGDTNFEKAESIFLGVTPRKFGINFLPSTRSMAFRKSAWEVVGGFPEGKNNSAEDTDFNYKAVKMKLRYAHAKDARVEWRMPKNIEEFFLKIKNYAKWDIRYGIWNHPKMTVSHNIKVLSVFFRYLLGLSLLISSFVYNPLSYLFFVLLIFYLFWAFRKVFLEFPRVEIAIFGPVIQMISDMAVMSGFLTGILRR